MQYRSFGKLEWKASALGFGAMRLPVVNGDPARINEPEAMKMIRYAIDHGLNYVDTAYPYHGGTSESFVGRVLKEGYREKVKLATKMPSWMIESADDMDKYLNEQLQRLGCEIDLYLLHGLNGQRWKKLRGLSVVDWAERKIDEGKFKHLGFSFHDSFRAFKTIVDSYDGWDFCQIEYNYSDEHYQAGTRGLEYAASKGLGVVVMEPIAGGRLAVRPPKLIQDLWDSAEVRRTQAEWALLWVWNHPEVSVTLSGMNTMQQVRENVETASHSGPGTLGAEELLLVKRVAQAYKNAGFIGCTGCSYCMPCPQGVKIPQLIALCNDYYVKGMCDEVKLKYWEQIAPESRAKNCAQCGKCEELCPQQLPIRNLMRQSQQIFGRIREPRKRRRETT